MKNILKISIVLFIVTSLSACYNDFRRHIVGNGSVTTETRQLGTFSVVSTSGSFDVEIINDSSESKVEIEAESNIIDVITTEVRGNELEIGFERRTWVSPRRTIKVKVFTNKLSGISLSGSGSISTQAFTGSDFEAQLSGSGNFDYHFTGNSTNCRISGSGRVTARGKVVSQEIKVSGSGDIEAFDMETEKSDITISGSGNARVFATKTLIAEISGSGDVIYKGSPSISTSISGSGKLRAW